MDSSRIDQRDWSALTYPQQVQQLETEGYLVLPDLLTADQLSALKKETAILETTAVDYSCLLYTSPSPRDKRQSRMPSSA